MISSLSSELSEYQEQQPHHLGLTVGNWDLTALLPGDALAVWSALGLARCRALYLLRQVKTDHVHISAYFPYFASEGVGHPDILNNLRLVVPELVAIGAVDLGHNELDVLGNQLAFLPCHRLTCFVTCPHLPIKAFKIHPILCETTRMSGDKGTQGYAVSYYCA